MSYGRNCCCHLLTCFLVDSCCKDKHRRHDCYDDYKGNYYKDDCQKHYKDDCHKSSYYGKDCGKDYKDDCFKSSCHKDDDKQYGPFCKVEVCQPPCHHHHHCCRCRCCRPRCSKFFRW